MKQDCRCGWALEFMTWPLVGRMLMNLGIWWSWLGHEHLCGDPSVLLLLLLLTSPGWSSSCLQQQMKAWPLKSRPVGQQGSSLCSFPSLTHSLGTRWRPFNQAALHFHSFVASKLPNYSLLVSAGSVLIFKNITLSGIMSLLQQKQRGHEGGGGPSHAWYH